MKNNFNEWELVSFHALSKSVRAYLDQQNHNLSNSDVQLAISSLKHYRVQEDVDDYAADPKANHKRCFVGRTVFYRLLKLDFPACYEPVKKVVDYATFEPLGDKALKKSQQHFLRLLFDLGELKEALKLLPDKYSVLNDLFRIFEVQLPHFAQWMNDNSEDKPRHSYIDDLGLFIMRFFGDLCKNYKISESDKSSKNENNFWLSGKIPGIISEFEDVYDKTIDLAVEDDCIEPACWRGIVEQWWNKVTSDRKDILFKRYFRVLDNTAVRAQGENHRLINKGIWHFPSEGTSASSELMEGQDEYLLTEQVSCDLQEVETEFVSEDSDLIVDFTGVAVTPHRKNSGVSSMVRHEAYARDLRLSYSRFYFSPDELRYLFEKIKSKDNVNRIGKERTRELLDVYELWATTCLSLESIYALVFNGGGECLGAPEITKDYTLRYRYSDDVEEIGCFESRSAIYEVKLAVRDVCLDRLREKADKQNWQGTVFSQTSIESWKSLIHWAYPGTFKGKKVINMLNKSLWAMATSLTAEQLLFCSVGQYDRETIPARYCWMRLSTLNRNLQLHAQNVYRSIFDISYKPRMKFKKEWCRLGVGSAKCLKKDLILKVLTDRYTDLRDKMHGRVAGTIDLISSQKGSQSFRLMQAKAIYTELRYLENLTQDIALAARYHNEGKIGSMDMAGWHYVHLADKETSQGLFDRIALEISWGTEIRRLIFKLVKAFPSLNQDEVRDDKYLKYIRAKINLPLNIKERLNYFRHALKSYVSDLLLAELAQPLTANALGHYRNSQHLYHLQSANSPYKEALTLKIVLDKIFPFSVVEQSP
jgi:hypothetical protein